LGATRNLLLVCLSGVGEVGAFKGEEGWAAGELTECRIDQNKSPTETIAVKLLVVSRGIACRRSC
jgi:hypothetical protein